MESLPAAAGTSQPHPGPASHGHRRGPAGAQLPPSSRPCARIDLAWHAKRVSAVETWEPGVVGAKRPLLERFQPKAKMSDTDKFLRCFGIKRNAVTQRREFSILPTGFDRFIGRMMYPGLIDSNGGISGNEDKKTLVRSIVTDLQQYTKHKDTFAWDIQVVSSRQMNAMALPGGKIVICEGIIDEITQWVQTKIDDSSMPGYTAEQGHKDVRAMLALVIGHEMAHSDCRHGAQSIQRMLLVYILLAIAFAVLKVVMLGKKSDAKTADQLRRLQGADKVFDALQELLTKVGMFFYNLAMSRKAENEADEVGMERLMEAGYNYHRAFQLFEVFKAKSGISHVANESERKIIECLSTHPTAETRLKRCAEHAKEFDAHIAPRAPVRA